MDATRFRGDDDAPAHRLDNVIGQGPGHRIEGQRPVDEPLDKFQATHLLLRVGTDGPVGFAACHPGIIVDRRELVSRFSDIIILRGRRGQTIALRRWSVLA